MVVSKALFVVTAAITARVVIAFQLQGAKVVASNTVEPSFTSPLFRHATSVNNNNNNVKKLFSTAQRENLVSPTAPIDNLIVRNGEPQWEGYKDTVRNGEPQRESHKGGTESAAAAGMPSFDNFDYLAHWYPVSWARDLPRNQATKVTLFDTDYVVARITGGSRDDKEDGADQVIAMLDRCPHKAAALSQGRITAGGYIQCSYHGWSFNGTTGDCVEIPQLVNANGTMDASVSGRACGTAVPAMIQQGVVFLFPGGNLEKALLAPLPPKIDEVDDPKFQVSLQVRELPVDWSIVVENIMDPDHGLFAHTSPAFDWYTASKELPQKNQEELLNNGKGWKISTKVDAVSKILAVDHKKRGIIKTKANPTPEEIVDATAIFNAPYFIKMGRRDKKTAQTKFLNGFYVSPVGTGRCRLLLAAVAKIPFKLPRWFMHISLNNFLDQDTYLLATQQKYILGREVENVKKSLQEDSTLPPNFSGNVRKTLFSYRSPTDKAASRIGNFWDATLHRAPNRLATLLSSTWSETPTREIVLDRNAYHLQLCPDSQDVVRNCRRIRKAATVGMLAVVAVALKAAAGSGGLFVRPTTKVAVGTLLASAALITFVADKIEREFYFKYDDKHHQKDLKKIPQKVWLDKK